MFLPSLRDEILLFRRSRETNPGGRSSVKNSPFIKLCRRTIVETRAPVRGEEGEEERGEEEEGDFESTAGSVAVLSVVGEEIGEEMEV
jgi:hypothetical protein